MQLEQIVEPSELLVPGEVFSVAEAAELGRQIRASVQKVAADVLETAKLCLQAYERYGSRGLSVVLRAADIEKAKFLKHTAIARDQRLGRIGTQLPASYSILYQLTQLSDEVLEEAVKAGIIHPDVRRAEIEALRKPLATKSRGPAQDSDLPVAVKEMAPGGRLEFVVPDDLDADACAQVRRALHRLQTKFRVKIVSIKELDTKKDVATPTATGGSPVNQSPIRTQPLAPPKLPKAAESSPAKSTP